MYSEASVERHLQGQARGPQTLQATREDIMTGAARLIRNHTQAEEELRANEAYPQGKKGQRLAAEEQAAQQHPPNDPMQTD